jgi:bifunctional non-homologous end joining protein LigD
VGRVLEELTKVKFTNLDKILYPNAGVQKSQVIKYYIRVAPMMLKFLQDRPLVTTRFPDGIDKEGFYEKDAPRGTPNWVETFRRYSKSAKRNLDYVVCNSLDTLLWLANLAALELHIPLSKTTSYEKPDLMFFDIDPEPPADINDAIDVAQLLKETLEHLSLQSYVKTSGKKGLHVAVPITPEYTYTQTREFVHQIGKHLAKQNERVVSEFSRSQEPNTVYIDYRQNSHGKTMVCPHSLRATKQAPISAPLEWSQLKKGLNPQKFNIYSVAEIKTDPWKGFFEHKQKLDV